MKWEERKRENRKKKTDVPWTLDEKRNYRLSKGKVEEKRVKDQETKKMYLKEEPSFS